MEKSEYMPDAPSPPCETVRDILEERGWPDAHFAAVLGWTEARLEQLMRNELEIDEELARDLARETDVPVRFWLKRQQRYNACMAMRQRNEVGTATRPQMMEILLYEDRWGDHVIVVKGNEQDRHIRRVRLHQSQRQSLGSEATLNVVQRCIEELEKLEVLK